MRVEASVLLSLFISQFLVPILFGGRELLPRLSSTLGERLHGGTVRIVVVLRLLRALRMLARVLAPKYDEGVTGARNPARVAAPVTLCSTVG